MNDYHKTNTFSPLKDAFASFKYRKHPRVILGLLQHVWDEAIEAVLPQALGEGMVIYSLKQKELLVLVPSSLWAQEIVLQSKALLRKLNTLLGENAVETIRTKLRSL